MRRLTAVSIAMILMVSIFFIARNQSQKSESILSDTCPPGFELVDGVCKVRTLYQLYSSLQNHGVGGLKTGLPNVRDGFTPQQIDLGRYLFFDPVLSLDGSVSCASCHNPALGYSDGKKVSIGINSEKVTRSAPTLWNVAWGKRFFWDARAGSLEEQAMGPLYAPHEMGNNPENLFRTLNSIENYIVLFDEAFPDGEIGVIELDEVYTAITAFEASLISLNSRYDQYAHGYHEALTETEIKGLNVFRSFVARCAECHTPPLFTNQQIAVIGVPDGEGLNYDKGAGITFADSSMNGGFKVPTLRNIEKTAPYMHKGQFDDLRSTVEFYTLGRGHAVPEERNLKLHWHIWEPQLQEYELDYLVAFLKTLTDESFSPAVPGSLPSGLNNLIEP